jgi:hypothetical protein
MAKASMLLLALALGGCVFPVRESRRTGAQDQGLSFRVALPPVLPPLVLIEPGISVLGDLDEEVFYADGSYWARDDAEWYRASDPHGAWDRVDRMQVAPALVRYPRGRYRHFKADEPGTDSREEGRRYGLDGKWD